MLAFTAYGIQKSKLKDTTDSRYKVGQVWGYWTRPQEKNSTFIVLKVEKHPTEGTIVHVAVRGLKVRLADGGSVDEVRHAPFTETALEGSGAKLVAQKAELPDYEAEYGRWREAFDAGLVLVSALTIADTVWQIEGRLNSGPQNPGARGEDKLLSGPIIQLYHRATNRTEVIAKLGAEFIRNIEAYHTLPGRYGARASFQSGLVLNQAHYAYEGVTPSAARAAWFTFLTNKKAAFNDLPPFTISVDGQTLYQGEGELSLNRDTESVKDAVQRVKLRVPVDVFFRVAAAKNVEFKIGDTTYKPESFQRQYMHAMATQIESQSK